MDTSLPPGTRRPRPPQSSGRNKPFLQGSTWDITGGVTIGRVSSGRGGGQGWGETDGGTETGGQALAAAASAPHGRALRPPPPAWRRRRQPRLHEVEFSAVSSVLQLRPPNGTVKRARAECAGRCCHAGERTRLCVFSFDFLPSFFLTLVCFLNMRNASRSQISATRQGTV